MSFAEPMPRHAVASAATTFRWPLAVALVIGLSAVGVAQVPDRLGAALPGARSAWYFLLPPVAGAPLALVALLIHRTEPRPADEDHDPDVFA